MRARIPSWKWRITASVFGWYAEPSEHGPQESPIGRIVCLGKVDEPHVERGALIWWQLVKSSNHVNRRPLRSEAAVLLWSDVFPFAVVAEVMGDYLEEDLASVRHERDASIVTALRPILLLAQHDVRGIFPLLRYAPAMPCGDHIGVQLL